MKNVLLFIFIICANFGAVAQYQSYFGKESTSWNITYRSQFGNPKTDTLVVLLDTIFEGHVWKKINIDIYKTFGYLREDTINGELWYKSESADTSLLCSKMNYILSDSIFIGKVGNKNFYTNIIEIYFDSLGLKHIVTDYQTDFLPLMEFVEGVGSTHTFLWNSIDRVSNNYLLCNAKDGNMSYINDTYPLYSGKCHAEDVVDGVYDLVNKNVVLAFPNPTAGNVSITLANRSAIKEIQVYDLLGSLVFSRALTQASSIETIELQKLIDGIYLLQIFDNKDNSYTQKLVLSR